GPLFMMSVVAVCLLAVTKSCSSSWFLTSGAKREPQRRGQARAIQNLLQPGGLRGAGRGRTATQGGNTSHHQCSRRSPRGNVLGAVSKVANSVRHCLPFIRHLGAVKFALRDQQLLSRFERVYVRFFSKHARSFRS